MNVHSKFQINPGLVLKDEEENAVLFDPETGSVYLLNLSVTAVMKHLRRPATIATVLRAVREECGGLDAAAEMQIIDLATQLVALNMLKPI